MPMSLHEHSISKESSRIEPLDHAATNNEDNFSCFQEPTNDALSDTEPAIV